MNWLLKLDNIHQLKFKHVSYTDKTSKAKLSFHTNIWDASNLRSSTIHYTHNAKNVFNGFCIGWDATNPNDIPENKHIEYRIKYVNGKWTPWQETHGAWAPGQSPSGLYWSHPQHSDNFAQANAIELKILKEDIKSIRLDLCEIIPSKKNKITPKQIRSNNCPDQPYIIPRTDWWGPLDSTEIYYPNANNSKQVAYTINTTHTFVHHGASSNVYANGADVVQFYWSLHVNSNGWKDIAYNFLVDHYGKIYKGRHNPDFPNQDAWGAHTGVCNPYSIAICLTGNFEDEYPTDTAVSSLVNMLSYQISLRGLDPLGKDFIVSDTIDVISGHRDAPGSSTACPGDSLHSWLPMIRQMVQDKIDSCNDLSLPNSSIDSFGSWQSQNMNITYSDNDSSTGIYRSFYLVTDLDSIGRTSNTQNGFLYDEFSSLRQEWIQQTGSWNVSNDGMSSLDDNESNTNIYRDFAIDSSHNYLFHLKSQIIGSGSNQRGGVHFGCDSAHLTNRGNSYFLLIREDDNEIQLLKTVNDTYNLVKAEPYGIGKYIWYDQKILWDVDAGIINVFINDQFLFSWQDTLPIKTGNSISFRTGNTEMDFNFLRIYKSRNDSTHITIGPQSYNDIRYQNPSPTEPSGKIWTFSVDSSLNISTLDYAYINVDWTPPDTVSFISDGNTVGVDIDTVLSFDHYSSYWGPSSDTHSGILSYEYSMGSSPGSDNLAGWNTSIDTFTLDSGQAVTNAQNIYYNVRAINNAGLNGGILSSNGQIVFWPAATANFSIDTNEMCYGDSIALNIQSQYYDSLVWMMGNATTLSYNDSVQWVQFDSSGTYPIYQMAFGPGGNNANTISNNIIVYPLPFADFSINDSLLSLGDPFAIFINKSTGGYAYLWDFGDGDTSLDIQPWHEYSSSGNYDVILITQSEHCGSDTLIKNNFVHINTGLEELRPIPIQIRDNVIHFKNGFDLKNVSLQLYDIQSRLINQWRSISNDRIDLKPYLNERAIYFLLIKENGQIIMKAPLFKK
ncbi:MAG TPA: hypothetical protein EYQ86_00140 [Bacteroidetes bacterium]|nr:hypothetical protein [Bacteroidota bacterium]